MKKRLQEKKITLATLKSFMKKSETLFIKNTRVFDWMTDSVTGVHNTNYDPIRKNEIDFEQKHTFWIEWLRLVWWGRDHFKYFEEDVYYGIEVWNCCGACRIVTK